MIRKFVLSNIFSYLPYLAVVLLCAFVKHQNDVIKRHKATIDYLNIRLNTTERNIAGLNIQLSASEEACARQLADRDTIQLILNKTPQSDNTGKVHIEERQSAPDAESTQNINNILYIRGASADGAGTPHNVVDFQTSMELVDFINAVSGR